MNTKKIAQNIYILKRSRISIILFSAFLTLGCNSPEIHKPKPGQVEDDNLVSEINNITLSENSEAFHVAPGAPSTWASFEAFFRACVTNSTLPNKSLFSKYKLLYLGPTNPRYLGSIYSKDGIVPRTELIKFVTSEQIQKFVTPGIDVPACDFSKIKDQFLSISLGNIPFALPDSSALKLALTKSDTLMNAVGTWTIDGLDADDFLRFLRENQSNPDIKYYNEVLLKDKHIVSFQVVKVNGFSADLIIKKGIDLDVNATIPIMKGKIAGGKDSTLFSLQFHKTNRNTIHIYSNGVFYAFALTMQGAKLK